GALYTYETHVLYVGPLIASARHAHHAGQVMWVPGGLNVEDESGVYPHVTAHLVPPHRFHAHGAAPAAAVLWIDHDDLPWDRAPTITREASRISREASSELPSTLGTRLAEPLGRDEADEVAEALLRIVAPVSPVRAPRHPA